MLPQLMEELFLSWGFAGSMLSQKGDHLGLRPICSLLEYLEGANFEEAEMVNHKILDKIVAILSGWVFSGPSILGLKFQDQIFNWESLMFRLYRGSCCG